MSGGYRLIIAAALGLAALVILGTGAYFGALYGTHYSQEAATAANRDASAKQGNPSQIDRDRAGLPETAERIASGPDPQSTDEREKRDLAAQESTSVWTFWMLVVSALGVVTTMLGTGFLLWQIQLTREAVQDTGRATNAMLEANEIAGVSARAWLSVEVRFVGPGVLYETQSLGLAWRFVAQAKIKNHGAAPASDVRFDAAIIFHGGDGYDFQSQFDEFCDSWRNRLVMTEYSGGTALFSGQDEVADHMVIMPEASIDNAPRLIEGTGHIAASLLGCLSYRTPHAPGVRQTRVSAYLTGPQGLDVSDPQWPLKIRSSGHGYVRAD